MGNKFTRKKNRKNAEKVKDVKYGRKIAPISELTPLIPGSSNYSPTSYTNRDTNQKEITYKNAKNNPKKNGYKNIVTIDVDVDTPQGAKSYHYEVDEDKFLGTSELNRILKEEISGLLLENNKGDYEAWSLPKSENPLSFPNIANSQALFIHSNYWSKKSQD